MERKKTTRERKVIIEVKDLTVRYGSSTIIKDVNFEIYDGEIFVIVGGSGCGKSTLLRQLIGLEKPTSGSIRINGEDFISSTENRKNDIKRTFGVLFQSGGMFASMTLAENISLLLENYTDLNIEQISNVVSLKLSAVGLGGCQNYLPEEISGGMKKRAALARAMTLDPEFLFFDEPSSGLDPVTAASLDELIKELNAALGTTMIVVTHDLSSILNIATRIIMLDKNKKGIIAKGTPDEMINITEIKSVYNFFNRLPGS